jgi:hypothetical protein
MELAAAAQAAGGQVSTASGFMEIAFPPPPSRAAAAPAPPATLPQPAPQASTTPVLARTPTRDLARMGTTLARASSGSAAGGADGGAVDSVLRQMRLENEQLGLVDGLDPLF